MSVGSTDFPNISISWLKSQNISVSQCRCNHRKKVKSSHRKTTIGPVATRKIWISESSVCRLKTGKHLSSNLTSNLDLLSWKGSHLTYVSAYGLCDTMCYSFLFCGHQELESSPSVEDSLRLLLIKSDWMQNMKSPHNSLGSLFVWEFNERKLHFD